jgi:maltodextrin utilization protein YvdJ
MAKTHMILQDKGGVGKSFIAARNKISKPRQAAIINLFVTAITMASIAVFLLIIPDFPLEKFLMEANRISC